MDGHQMPPLDQWKRADGRLALSAKLWMEANVDLDIVSGHPNRSAGLLPTDESPNLSPFGVDEVYAPIV